MSTPPFRLANRGLVDRSSPLGCTVDGVHYSGYRGDTVASTLLAHGVHQVSRSVRFGRPRGIMAAGVEEPSALLQIENPFPEPMRTASTLELDEILAVHGVSGYGTLASEPDPARYDRRNTHCEILVVGAGPAGLRAALTAARAGSRVILVDDKSRVGGSLLGSTDVLDDVSGAQWAERAASELRGYPKVTVLERTRTLGYYDDNYLIAVQQRGNVSASGFTRQRVWQIRAREVVLATGAYEQPLIFADNDRPGIMLAGAARTYLNRYGVLAGSRAVVCTTNDSAYPAAIELAAAGVEVQAVVDTRSEIPSLWAERCARRYIEVLPWHAPCGTTGHDRVSAVDIQRHGTDQPARRFDCDLVLVSGGWNPAVALLSQARGSLRHDDAVGASVPHTCPPGVTVAGAARGEFGLDGCLRDGADAATVSIERAGLTAGGPLAEIRTRASETRQCAPDRIGPIPARGAEQRQFVDLARDATVADVRNAIAVGMCSVEHIKRYTSIGTGHDQGRTSGTALSWIVAAELGSTIAEVGATSFRPPDVPVAFAALAGRDRGDLFDPARTTALHQAHRERGAHWENVGQWKRPRYYPFADESMAQAVRRECRAARGGVAVQDVSTLGKIDVQGPDSAEFLDRLYTNMMSTVKVGRIRYGLMCKADGMVFDDGTVARLDEHHFLVTTTTGNAAAVLDWMEEWLQTEWPDLQVHCTSVTDQWATIALVGPKSRQVLAEVASTVDVDNGAFGFMTWRDAEVAGASARVCRISFSGELAYEINVRPWVARAVWEALIDAGAPYGITPYGTETMHVLRAEKGYPIVGQDTDGTATPYDLGMSWAVSTKKADFVGKRSLARQDILRDDRQQFVGLLPVETSMMLEEGTQLVPSSRIGPPPVPTLGHVTSSYFSDALGRTFALALVAGGRARLGETVHAVLGSETAPVTVTDTVLVDQEGARRDG